MNFKNNICFILLLFIITSTAIASKRPNKNLQSSKLALKDSIRKNIYNNPDKAIFFLHKYLKNNKDKSEIITVYGALGVAHNLKNNTDSTLFYFNKGLMLCDKPSDIIAFKYDIGKIYEQEYNFEYALLLYKQCYDLAKREGFLDEHNKIKHALALMENEIGQPDKALKLLKEMYVKEKKGAGEVRNLKYTRKHLAETYIKVNYLDSALLVIDEGILAAENNNNVEFKYHFRNLKAQALLSKKQDREAELEIFKSLKEADILNNLKFKNESNYILSLIKAKQNKHKESIEIIKKILDSEVTKTIEDQSRYYKLLASNYDALDSNKLSVIYYKKFSKVEQKVTEKRLTTLDNIYDIDLNEKIIEKKEQKNKTQFWLIAFIIISALGIMFFIRIKIKQKKNQRLFNELMIRVNRYEENKKASKKQVSKDNLNKVSEEKKNIEEINELSIEKTQERSTIKENSETTTHIIDDERVEEILLKIKQLEDKQYYLKQECTMHNMAKRLKTNTSYLSKIINTHLNKTFSSYINELRMDYIIIELKNNKKLRSYSVKAISEELGYKSADSFSKYFKEATGLTPSVYIKKIGKIH